MRQRLGVHVFMLTWLPWLILIWPLTYSVRLELGRIRICVA